MKDVIRKINEMRLIKSCDTYKPEFKVIKTTGKILLAVGVLTAWCPATGSCLMVLCGLPMIGIKLSPNPLKTLKIIKGFISESRLNAKLKLSERYDIRW